MLPTGIITFLYTDIQGSTPLWEQKPEAMKISMTRHHFLLRQAIESNGGIVFKIIGDAFFGVFLHASQGLSSALAAQRFLQSEKWNETGPLRVRMGVHTGPAELDELGEYSAHTLNRVSRVMSVACGGQILLTQETADQVSGDLPPGVTLKDLGEHRMKGMLRLEHLYQAVSPDLPHEFPPLSTGVVNPNNLPVLISSFVGREAEIAEIERLVAPNKSALNRLTTLFGPGGTGKTRLSLQIGHQMLESFSGGIWFIELAALTNPELVPQMVMTAVGLQPETNRPGLVVLGDYFREKTALLILDNCEHLVEASACLSESLLRACPNLRILASSREPLGITGEVVYPVPPLTITQNKCPTPEEVLNSEAGRLFFERAASVQPGFSVNAMTAPAIAQVCRQLDGIPLAIELAAVRVRLLAVDQIATHLDDRFRLLTGGSRTVLPRHQTLKALVDWSWDLLTLAEQTLLRRLSVFAGGWTLEAAQYLEDDPFETLDCLYNLANKSLIILDERIGQPNRFRMLETIRQYSLGKLFIAGEDQEMRTRHRNWFLAMATQAEPELKKHAQIAWSNRLEFEHDNLRVAFEWAIEEGEIEAALRLASALHYFWWIRGYYEEGRRCLEAALQLAEKAPEIQSGLWQMRALLALSWIKKSQGDYVGGLTVVEAGLRIARQLGDQQSTAFALYLKSIFLFDRMKPTAHRSILEESVSICEAIDEKWIMAGCLYHLSEICTDYREGYAFLEKSVESYRGCGDKLNLTFPLAGLAWANLARGDPAKAQRYFEEGLAISRETGRNDSTAFTALQLSVLARWQGDFTSAQQFNEESLAIYVDLGNRQGQAWARCLLGELNHLQGHPELAIAPYQESLNVFPEISDNWKSGWCYEKLGDAYYHLGDYDQAILALERSMALLGQDSETHHPTLILGEVERVRGNFEGAANYYRQSLVKLKETGVPLFVPSRLEALAKVALAQGNPEQAARLFGAAQAAREKMGTPIPPIDLPDYERHLAWLVKVMDEKCYSSAWEAGRVMTLQEAEDLAMAEVSGLAV